MAATAAPPLLDPADLSGQQLIVHRNLHRPGHTWSVRRVGQSRIAGHVDRPLVLTDVQFRIQAGGQARARQQGHRNVHAFVVGTVRPATPRGSWRQATYDPFSHDTFVDRTTNVPLAPSMVAAVRLDDDGMWWLPAR